MCEEFWEYKEVLEEIRLTQDSKKELVKALAEREPERKNRRLARPLRAAVIAACLCLALVGTALAASPELRGMLAEALGAFKPYAQEVDSPIYEYDGFALKVLSALSDGTIARVYVEVRDTEGDRLSHGDIWGVSYLYQHEDNETRVAHGYSTETNCVSYDPESGVALLEISAWGDMMESSKTTLSFCYVSSDPVLEGEQWLQEVPGIYNGLPIELELEDLPSVIYEMDPEQWTGFPVTQVKVSPLGITTVTYGMDFDAEGHFPPRWMAGLALRAALADGTVQDLGELSGRGLIGGRGQAVYLYVDTWGFKEPVDPKQVVGFYLENADPRSTRGWKGITYVENAYPDGVYIPLK